MNDRFKISKYHPFGKKITENELRKVIQEIINDEIKNEQIQKMLDETIEYYINSYNLVKSIYKHSLQKIEQDLIDSKSTNKHYWDFEIDDKSKKVTGDLKVYALYFIKWFKFKNRNKGRKLESIEFCERVTWNCNAKLKYNHQLCDLARLDMILNAHTGLPEHIVGCFFAGQNKYLCLTISSSRGIRYNIINNINDKLDYKYNFKDSEGKKKIHFGNEIIQKEFVNKLKRAQKAKKIKEILELINIKNKIGINHIEKIR